MSRLVPITALILAGALSVAQADVYRWVDAQGVPHYSDEWVPGSVVIRTSHPRPDSPSSSSSSDSLSSQSSRIHEQVSAYRHRSTSLLCGSCGHDRTHQTDCCEEPKTCCR